VSPFGAPHPVSGPEPARLSLPALLGELVVEVDRVADRLRGLSLHRLEAPLPPRPSRAAAARHVAQVLADAAAAIEERTSTSPSRPPVPSLSVFAAGDQVAVTGPDLVAAVRELLADVPPGDACDARGERQRAADVPPVALGPAATTVAAALQELVALRRQL
jgi:hypothetical protein